MTLERAKLCLDDPLFLCAYLFHHMHNGLNLSPAQVAAATNYARGQGVDGQDITQYLAQMGPFDKVMFRQDVDEVSWWSAGRRYGFPDKLCDLAVRLHQTMATTAALERHLSTMRLTYGTLRTRLGVEQAKKLSFIQRSVNGAQSPDGLPDGFQL
jgi:hypothetical protein